MDFTEHENFTLADGNDQIELTPRPTMTPSLHYSVSLELHPMWFYSKIPLPLIIPDVDPKDSRATFQNSFQLTQTQDTSFMGLCKQVCDMEIVIE